MYIDEVWINWALLIGSCYALVSTVFFYNYFLVINKSKMKDRNFLSAIFEIMFVLVFFVMAFFSILLNGKLIIGSDSLGYWALPISISIIGIVSFAGVSMLSKLKARF